MEAMGQYAAGEGGGSVLGFLNISQESQPHPVSSCTFILVGSPGMEPARLWLSVPFCLMYVVSLLGNGALLCPVCTERSLHRPVYVFLSMLAAANLMPPTTTVPKTRIFWFQAREISFEACLAQMFLIRAIFVPESAFLMAMAFDRYIAICDPSRYTVELSNSVIRKIGMAATTRSFCLVFPVIFLVKRLTFCQHSTLPHTYCEHMGIARLACSDITTDIWYGFAVALPAVGLDALLVAASNALILRAIVRVSSKAARRKALGTCGSRLRTILMFYTAAFFSFFAHRFGHHIPGYIHILLASLYVLVPPMLNPTVYGVKPKEVLERGPMYSTSVSAALSPKTRTPPPRTTALAEIPVLRRDGL
ncbi:LOW QUALITY PROTEIN: olfactory receptor 52B2-like [Liasis olivaceus]